MEKTRKLRGIVDILFVIRNITLKIFLKNFEHSMANDFPVDVDGFKLSRCHNCDEFLDEYVAFF